jgi:enamine deaminase RidA (YjgF/YER057c/UK114 family)
MGYKFQFVTLAGFHALNHAMYELARGYRERGMAAYSELQEREFAAERQGYTATRHQREVGVGYFDAVATAISGGAASTLALAGSTEAAQFTATTRESGATPATDQIRAALDADHAKLEAALERIEQSRELQALSASLDELSRMLTEHFAHEEHAKGFYGVLGAKGPEYRAELARMIDEHQLILGALKELVERTKGPGATPGVLVRQSGAFARQLLAHEAREVELAGALG